MHPSWTAPEIRSIIQEDKSNDGPLNKEDQVPPSLSKMTVPQLQSALEDLGVDYPARANRGLLMRLLRDHGSGGASRVLSFGRFKGYMYKETPESYRNWAIRETDQNIGGPSDVRNMVSNQEGDGGDLEGHECSLPGPRVQCHSTLSRGQRERTQLGHATSSILGLQREVTPDDRAQARPSFAAIDLEDSKSSPRSGAGSTYGSRCGCEGGARDSGAGGKVGKSEGQARNPTKRELKVSGGNDPTTTLREDAEEQEDEEEVEVFFDCIEEEETHLGARWCGKENPSIPEGNVGHAVFSPEGVVDYLDYTKDKLSEVSHL